jgi:hypothetical protein
VDRSRSATEFHILKALNSPQAKIMMEKKQAVAFRTVITGMQRLLLPAFI